MKVDTYLTVEEALVLFDNKIAFETMNKNTNSIKMEINDKYGIIPLLLVGVFLFVEITPINVMIVNRISRDPRTIPAMAMSLSTLVFSLDSTNAEKVVV